MHYLIRQMPPHVCPAAVTGVPSVLIRLVGADVPLQSAAPTPPHRPGYRVKRGIT